MTLADSLKQALAFEEGWLGDDNFVCGMRSAHARLAPLHAALIKCAEELELLMGEPYCDQSVCCKRWRKPDEAIFRLKGLVGE